MDGMSGYVVLQYKKDLSPCIIDRNRIKEINKVNYDTTEIVLKPMRRLSWKSKGRAVQVLGSYNEVICKIAGEIDE